MTWDQQLVTERGGGSSGELRIGGIDMERTGTAARDGSHGPQPGADVSMQKRG